MSKQNPLQTTVLLLLLLVFIQQRIITKDPFLADCLFYSIFLFGLTATFFPSFSNFVHFGWMKIGESIGLFISRVFLLLIFLFVLLPISLANRAFKKSTLLKDFDSSTYFKNTSKTFEKKDFLNPW